jgi:hypothetical protein
VSQNQTKRRANGNNAKKEYKESKIGTNQLKKVANSWIGQGGRS